MLNRYCRFYIHVVWEFSVNYPFSLKRFLLLVMAYTHKLVIYRCNHHLFEIVEHRKHINFDQIMILPVTGYTNNFTTFLYLWVNNNAHILKIKNNIDNYKQLFAVDRSYGKFYQNPNKLLNCDLHEMLHLAGIHSCLAYEILTNFSFVWL